MVVCPILAQGKGVSEPFCIREDCAWWNDIEEICAVLTLAKEV